MSSKSGGILGPALGRRQDGEKSVSWRIKKDVIWLSTLQNRRTFQKVWDSKTKTEQEQMEWEGLGEERGEREERRKQSPT